jgi:hypothetical protein
VFVVIPPIHATVAKRCTQSIMDMTASNETSAKAVSSEA